MAGKAAKEYRTPASVNLKRLYLCLLVLTIAVGSVSLAIIQKSSRSIDVLAEIYDPAHAWIDEMLSSIGEARITFHRSIIPPDHQAWSSEDLIRLVAEVEHQNLPFQDPFFQDVGDSVHRLAGLSRLTEDIVHRGQWEELQIIIRDFDRTSGELAALLLEEQARIHEIVRKEEKTNRKRFLLTSLILSLSLLISLVISLGLYLNWRRLERTVLGIDS